MIQIIKPGSSQIRIGTDDAILEWSSEESGQTAYEIMYKLKTETVWNTFQEIFLFFRSKQKYRQEIFSMQDFQNRV